MVDCCNHSKKAKKCTRKKDKKTFKLPRRFSKEKCRNPKGFTMRSSCAPYKDCFKKGGKNTNKKNRKIQKKKISQKKKLTYKKNILNKPIQVCSTNPMTGFYRDGYCMTGSQDYGTHTVCATMDNDFLNYTKSKGNDLSSVVKSGENWCLCEYRWNEAFKDGKAPHVVKESTNMRTKNNIIRNINKNTKGGKKTKKEKPHFLFNPNDPKKSFDVYTDKNPNDTIPIKYTTLQDVKNTIKKLEKLYKTNKYPHKRIWQVGMIMYVRLKVLKDKKPKEFKLSQKYFKFLGKRTKIKEERNRKKFIFKF